MARHVDVVARRRRSTVVLRAARRLSLRGPWGPATGATVLVLLSAASVLALRTWPQYVPWTVFVPLVLLAGLFLPPRLMIAVHVCVLAAFGVGAASSGAGQKDGLAGASVVLFVVLGLMVWLARSRARLGVSGTLGESMLVDLRDRLRAHGELPELPEQWQAEVSLHSAYGESFSGDFIVAGRSDDGSRFELALVDVSGKGLSAGTRALLLSGALGGLLGAMEPDAFLPAANSYLLGQRWNEGFATAIHLALDLETGEFCLGTAGHPPGAQFNGGSGRWNLLDDAGGPLLGVLPGACFPRAVGRLERGDALLLYTDGVVEARNRDLTVGIDRMLGAAERQVSFGFSGAADRICASSRAGESDDRAAFVIWRR